MLIGSTDQEHARAQEPRTTDLRNPIKINLAHGPGLTNPKINLLGKIIGGGDPFHFGDIWKVYLVVDDIRSLR